MIPNNWKQPKCPPVGEHINTKLIQNQPGNTMKQLKQLNLDQLPKCDTEDKHARWRICTYDAVFKTHKMLLHICKIWVGSI